MPKVKSNHSEFLIGDAVRYIGDAIIPIGVEGLSRKRYADIVLHIFEYGVGGEFLSCAWLLPDGRVSTWIAYVHLKPDPFSCWRKSTVRSPYTIQAIDGDRVNVPRRDKNGIVRSVILRSDRQEELVDIELESGTKIKVLPQFLDVLLTD